MELYANFIVFKFYLAVCSLKDFASIAENLLNFFFFFFFFMRRVKICLGILRKNIIFIKKLF